MEEESAKTTGKEEPDMTSEDGTLLSNESRTGSQHEIGNEIENSLPIDRGWAWVILFAAVFEVFLFGGVMKSTGIFFVEYQTRFDSSASETFLVSTVQNIVLSIMSLLVMNILLNRISCRTCVIVGGFLFSASYLITAFVEEFQILHFSLGILGGMGISMTYLPIISTVGIYFDKYRGLANSVTVSGSSIGGLVFAPVITTLFDCYGYTGAMMIVSAILLNIVISGSLLWPMESHVTPKERRIREILLEDGIDACDMQITNVQELPLDPDFQKSKVSMNGSTTSRDENNLDVKSDSPYSQENSSAPSPQIRRVLLQKQHPVRTLSYQHSLKADRKPGFLRMQSHDPTQNPSMSPKSLRNRTTSTGTGSRIRSISVMSGLSHAASIVSSINQSKVANFAGTDFACGSLLDLGSISSLSVTKYSKTIETQISNGTTGYDEELADTACCLNIFVSKSKHCLSAIFDCSLLTSPVFLWFLLMAVCIQPGSILVSICIAPHAKDAGLSSTQIGGILSIAGCVDFFSRIGVGVVSDRNWVRSTTIMGTAAIVMGVLVQFMRFFQSFSTLVFFAVMAGMCCGVYTALYAVVLIDFLGMEKFKSSLGFTGLFHGVAVAAYFPLIGALRDSTGSYLVSFHMVGVILCLGAVFALTLPLVHSWNEKRIKKRKLPSSEPKKNIIYKPTSQK